MQHLQKTRGEGVLWLTILSSVLTQATGTVVTVHKGVARQAELGKGNRTAESGVS